MFGSCWLDLMPWKTAGSYLFFILKWGEPLILDVPFHVKRIDFPFKGANIVISQIVLKDKKVRTHYNKAWIMILVYVISEVAGGKFPIQC